MALGRDQICALDSLLVSLHHSKNVFERAVVDGWQVKVLYTKDCDENEDVEVYLHRVVKKRYRPDLFPNFSFNDFSAWSFE